MRMDRRSSNRPAPRRKVSNNGRDNESQGMQTQKCICAVHMCRETECAARAPAVSTQRALLRGPTVIVKFQIISILKILRSNILIY